MKPENNIPEIIEQAAKSTLGVFSLMIIALSIIAFVFFKRGSQRIKLSIFLLLFAGVACFGVAVSRESKQSPTPIPAPTPLPPGPISGTEEVIKRIARGEAFHISLEEPFGGPQSGFAVGHVYDARYDARNKKITVTGFNRSNNDPSHTITSECEDLHMGYISLWEHRLRIHPGNSLHDSKAGAIGRFYF